MEPLLVAENAKPPVLKIPRGFVEVVIRQRPEFASMPVRYNPKEPPPVIRRPGSAIIK